MLAGLDEVEWATLSHAFGPAVDVPALLRSIDSGGSDADAAIYELFGNIWHQGTIYEATAASVPFVGELARSSEVSESRRVLLIMLLFVIGRGRGYWQVHADARPFPPDPGELETALRREELWVERCRAAVKREAVLLLDELANVSGKLWIAAATMIVVAGHDGEPYRPLPTPPGATDALVPTGLTLIEAVLSNRQVTEDQLATIKDLDAELANYLDTEPGGRLDEDGIGAFFIELLVERMVETSA